MPGRVHGAVISVNFQLGATGRRYSADLWMGPHLHRSPEYRRPVVPVFQARFHRLGAVAGAVAAGTVTAFVAGPCTAGCVCVVGCVCGTRGTGTGGTGGTSTSASSHPPPSAL